MRPPIYKLHNTSFLVKTLTENNHQPLNFYQKSVKFSEPSKKR